MDKYQDVWVIERVPLTEEDTTEYMQIKEGIRVNTTNIWDAMWFYRKEDAHEFASYIWGEEYEKYVQLVSHRMYLDE